MTIEYSLTNKCNLNCAGCFTFSPLVKRDNSVSPEKLQNDFKKLHEIAVEHIGRIIITGGEPLLYKDINTAISYLATLFKDAEIGIFTNSTLLLKKDKEFFDILKTYRVKLYLSIYPVDTDYDEIYSLLKKEKIDYAKWGIDHLKDRKRKFF